ncbi:predicted protein [Naegleria gruberi]|uniref:Predicted protein n=1 Tax=Naegleria gruberi TaxID=5762 RepID=D2UXT7_NAEGR|nr:uncharacterized protein NAEGRDRAFT_77711 [Naegleria gruberi]EFC50344.1 predicted protein [Naegleria gruberi]|eukprot:XP_002683088.1 predicted protein [Naegleria gruberi strain NEG-M]
MLTTIEHQYEAQISKLNSSMSSGVVGSIKKSHSGLPIQNIRWLSTMNLLNKPSVLVSNNVISSNAVGGITNVNLQSSSLSSGVSSAHSNLLSAQLISDPLFLYSNVNSNQSNSPSSIYSKQDVILEQLYTSNTSPTTSRSDKQEKSKTFTKQFSFDMHIAEMGGKSASTSNSIFSNQNVKNILVDPQLEELLNRYRSQITCINTSDNGKFVVFAIKTNETSSNNSNSTPVVSKPNILIIIYSRSQQIQNMVNNLNKTNQNSQPSMSQKIKTYFNGSSNLDSSDSKKTKKGNLGHLLGQIKVVQPPRGMQEMDGLSWRKKLKSVETLNRNINERNISKGNMGDSNDFIKGSSHTNQPSNTINISQLPPVSVKQIFISNDGYNVVCVTENNDIWLYDCFPSSRSNIANLFKYENSMFRINNSGNLNNSTNMSSRSRSASSPQFGNVASSFGSTNTDSKRMSDSRNTINATLLPSSNIDSMLEEETFHRYLMKTNNQGLFAIDDFGLHYQPRNSVVGNELLPTPREPIVTVSGMNIHSSSSSSIGNYLQYSIEEWTILPSHLDGVDNVNYRSKEGTDQKQVLLPNEDIHFDIKFCHSPIHGRFCQISSAIVSKMFVKYEIYKKMQSMFQANIESPEKKKVNASLGVINSNNASIMKHEGFSPLENLPSSSSLLKEQGLVIKDKNKNSDDEDIGPNIKARRSPSVFRHMASANISTSADISDSDSDSSDTPTLSRQNSLVSLANSVKIPKLKLNFGSSEKKTNDRVSVKREMAFETVRNDNQLSKKSSNKNIGRMSMILSRSGLASAFDTSSSGISTPRLTSRVGTFSGASADQVIPTLFDDFNNLPTSFQSKDLETPNILSRCLLISNCTVFLSKRKFIKSANSFNTNPIPTPRFPIIDHCPFHLSIDRTYTVLDKVLDEEDVSMTKVFHGAAKQKSIPECIVKWDNETSMLCVVANSFDHSSLFESKVFFYSPIRRKSVCVVYGTKSLECLPMSRTSRNPTELVSFSVQDMCWSNNSLFIILVDARGNMSMISRLNEFMLMKDKQLLQQSAISNFVPFYKNHSESRDLETTKFSVKSHPYQGQFIVSDGFKVKLFNFVSERDEIDLTTILSSYHGSCYGIEQYIFHATYDKKSRVDTALDIWRLCVSHPQLSRFQKQNHNYLEFVIKKMSEYILNHGDSFSKKITSFFEILQDSLDWSINGVQNPSFLLPYLIKLTEMVFRKFLKKEKKQNLQRLANFLEETEAKCNELVHYCQSCFVWDTNTLGDSEADSIRQSPIILFDCWVELGQSIQTALNRMKNKPNTSDIKATVLKIISSEKKAKSEAGMIESSSSDESDQEIRKKPANNIIYDSDESDTSTEYLGDDIEDFSDTAKVISSDEENEDLENTLKKLLELVIKKLKNRTAYLSNKTSVNGTFLERYSTTLNPKSKSIFRFTNQDVKYLLTGNNQYMLGNYKKAIKYYMKIHESNEAQSPTTSATIPSTALSYYTKSTVLFLANLFMYDITEIFRVLNDQMHTGIVDLVRSSGVLLEHHKNNISKGLGSGVLRSTANMNVINAVITLLTALYEKKNVYILSPVFYQIIVDKNTGNDNKNISIDLVIVKDITSKQTTNSIAYYYIPLDMSTFKTNFENEMKKRSVNGKSIVNQLLLETGRIHEAIRFCLRFDYKKAYTIFLVTNGMLGSKETTDTSNNSGNNSAKPVPTKKSSTPGQKKNQYDIQQIVHIYKELLYEYLDKEDSKEVNTILSTTDFFIPKQSDELRVGAIETYLRKLQLMLKETCSLLFLSKEDFTSVVTTNDNDTRRRNRSSVLSKEKKLTRKLEDLLDREFMKSESYFLSNLCQFITSQKPSKPTRKQREYYLSLLDAIRSGNLLPHITFREYRLKYLRRINEDVVAYDESDGIPFSTPVTTNIRGDNISNLPLITVIEKECEKSVRFLLMDQLIIFSNIPNLSFIELLKYYQNDFCKMNGFSKGLSSQEKQNQLSLYIKPFRFLCRFLWYCHITEEMTSITSNNRTNPFKLLYNHSKKLETESDISDLTDTLVYTCELFAFLLDFREFFTRSFLESTVLTILTVAINISHNTKDEDDMKSPRRETDTSQLPHTEIQNDTTKKGKRNMIAETVCRILAKHMHDSQQVVPHLGKRYVQLSKALDENILESKINEFEAFRQYKSENTQVTDQDNGSSILWTCEIEESYWTFLQVFFNDVLSNAGSNAKDLMTNITAAISQGENSTSSLIVDSLNTLKHSLAKIKNTKTTSGTSIKPSTTDADSNRSQEQRDITRQLSAKELINDFNNMVSQNNNGDLSGRKIIPNRRTKSVISTNTTIKYEDKVEETDDTYNLQTTEKRNDYENSNEKYPTTKKKTQTLDDPALGLIIDSISNPQQQVPPLNINKEDEKKKPFSIKNFFKSKESPRSSSTISSSNGNKLKDLTSPRANTISSTPPTHKKRANKTVMDDGNIIGETICGDSPASHEIAIEHDIDSPESDGEQTKSYTTIHI